MLIAHPFLKILIYRAPTVARSMIAIGCLALMAAAVAQSSYPASSHGGFEVCQGTQDSCAWQLSQGQQPDVSQSGSAPAADDQPPYLPGAMSVVRAWQPLPISPDLDTPDIRVAPCAAIPTDALARFAGAQEQSNINRALEFYDWTNLSEGQATVVITRLEGLGVGHWEKDSIIASMGADPSYGGFGEPQDSAAPVVSRAGRPPSVRWVGVQSATFSWHQTAGCWFLRFDDAANNVTDPAYSPGNFIGDHLAIKWRIPRFRTRPWPYYHRG
jgi:hypothetical protein